MGVIMKKLLFILSIFLCLFTYKINGLTNDYAERIYTIEFDNLSSKKINELFNGINAKIILVTVKTSRFTQEYRFNLSMTNNLERDLSELVINDLKSKISKEEISVIEVSGFSIKSIELRCNKLERDLILNRV